MCSSYRRSKMEKRKGRCGRFLIMCRLEKARKIVLFGTDLLSFEAAEYFPMSRLNKESLTDEENGSQCQSLSHFD